MACCLMPPNHYMIHWSLGRCGCNFDSMIYKLIIHKSSLGTQCEIDFRWMPQNLTNEKSALVQVMTWCDQATNHYLSQCWPRSMLPMKLIPKGLINNIPALVQIMAWLNQWWFFYWRIYASLGLHEFIYQSGHFWISQDLTIKHIVRYWNWQCSYYEKVFENNILDIMIRNLVRWWNRSMLLLQKCIWKYS